MNPIRGRLARARVFALVTAVAALGACSGEGPREARAPRVQPIGSFIAEVDVAAGTVTVTPLGGPFPMGLSSWIGLEEIPVVQDNVLGNAAEGTVELRTVSAGTVVDGCGPANDSFEGQVEIHSGFSAHKLVKPYVEIISISLTGHESCASAPPPGKESGVTEDGGGLFPYPDIAANGYGTARWSFRTPTQANFSFVGRLMAEVVETTPPVTSATYANYAVTLSCADVGGTGCAGTFFSVDGLATTAYAAPIRLSGSHTVCYRSEDVAGNAEGPSCGTFNAIGAPVVTATYGGTPAVPRCSGLASSCDTGALVVGVGALGPGGLPEPHQPNTLDACADTFGSGPPNDVYGAVESVEKLTLRTLDGGPLAPGRAVELAADVIAFLDDDVLDVFYATTTVTPTWTFVGEVVTAAGGGPQTLSLPFTLPARTVAVRALFSDTSFQQDACGSAVSSYSDQDDLVIELNEAPAGGSAPTVSITSPAALAILSRTVLVRVDATDDVAVTSVQLFSRSGTNQTWTLRGTDTSPPWVFEYDTNVDLDFTELRAVATDNAGSTAEAIIEVDVDDRTPPAVAITNPGAGQSFSRAGAITLGATAQDTSGLWDVVEWFVDGTSVGTSGAPVSGNLFNATWTPGTSWALGTHTIVLRAEDVRGNVGQSAGVQFTLTP